MNYAEFQDLIAQGTLLLDGATGSNLRAAGMPVGVCTEKWVLEHPQVLLDLQRAYVDAGSRVIYAPTFTASRAGLSLHGLEGEVARYNRDLVALSKEAANGRALVAGDVTTLGMEYSYEQRMDIYAEQIGLLAENGADLIIAETMLTIDETLAALDAAQMVCDLPVMCSMTIESDGGLLYGGSIVEAIDAFAEMGAAAAGLNCSLGPDQLDAIVRSMAFSAKIPLIVKPNAGLPTIDEHGVAHYSMSAADFAASMKRLVKLGASVVGGCCGTTPEHIRLLRDALAE